MKTFVEQDYELHAAGRMWVLPEVTLAELPDGSVGISAQELERAHRAIANAICGSPERLSVEELEFLCDVADVTFTELANYLDVDKSTVTQWRRRGVIPRRPIGLLAKKWFWLKLFGKDAKAWRLALSVVSNEERFLDHASKRAIDRQYTVPVEEVRPAS